MANNEYEKLDWEAVHARIVAIEILMECVFEQQVVQQRYMKTSDFLNGTEAQLIFSIQNMERPLDEQTDRIYGHAADAIKEFFAQTKNRIG
jgi:hypothetical protein